MYGRECGTYYNGIAGGLTAYGISENNVAFVNYFTDTKETAEKKVQNAEYVHNGALKLIGEVISFCRRV